MDFETMMKNALRQHLRENGDGEEYESKSDAYEALSAFLDTPRLTGVKIGDRLERNDFGKIKYTSPKGNQVAVVYKIFDEIQYDEGDENDMRMAITIGKNHFRFFDIDSRYYRKVDAKRNVYEFNKKGN